MNETKNPTDQSERVIELFDRVRQIEPSLRAQFLAEACVDAPELRQEVESLLAFDDEQPVLNATSALKAAARLLADDDLTGREIGHYRILGLLGAGGMGRVYVAEDHILSRQIALKFLPESFTATPERVRRFAQEARAASALNHPNIITVYETGEHEGRHYIAYELVEGQTLRERLNGAPLGWPEAVAIGAQMAAALKAAHSTGLIHRDIKPENVMLRPDGLVKVLDFGIAKRLELRAEEASGNGGVAQLVSITQAGQVFGTLGYLAPEQARGEPLDACADIFAFGLVLYEMLAGHPAASLSHTEKLERLLAPEEWPDIGRQRRDLPAALTLLVNRAVRKERGARYQSIAPVLETLQELSPLRSETVANLQGVAAEARKQNANRLLNRFIVLAAAEPQTRLPFRALWTIWRSSDLPRHKLERTLLRRSLLNALGKWVIWVSLAALVTLAVMAVLALATVWDERILRDGHGDMARQLALSPDGRTLVSVGDDNAVIVWDLPQRKRRATLTAHTRSVRGVAFAPNSKWFATAGKDGQVIVWDALRLTQAAVLPGRSGGQMPLAFTLDSRLLIATRQSGKEDRLTYWETGSWRRASITSRFSNFALSPDGRFVLMPEWDFFLLPSGQFFRREIAEDELPKSQPKIGQWTADPWEYGVLAPDGARFASTDSGGFVSFWDLRQFWRGGAPLLLARYPAHSDHGRAMAYSPDGRLVASGSESIIVWDARTQAKLARFTHRDLVTSLVFTPDAKQLISAHGDGAIIIWDLAEHRIAANLAEHSGIVRAVGFSPDGQTIASASEDYSIVLWDAVSGLRRTTLSDHYAPVAAVAFAADGKALASSDIYGNALLWDAATYAPMRRFAPPRKQASDLAYCVALSPDHQWLATTFGIYATGDGRLAVDFVPLRQMEGTPEFHSAAFSPDGRWLACVSTGGYVRLWQVGQWTKQEVRLARENMVAVAFSPDGRWLATGEGSGTLRLWQIEPLRETAVIGRHTANIESVAFSPDGGWLLSASDDETVALWDVAQRRFLGHVGQHKPAVNSAAFSPDGERIVTGEQDKTVRLYQRRRKLWGWLLD